LGVRIDHAEDGQGLPSDVDLVVASAAIPPSHPQLIEARARGLTIWKYAELLGALMADRFAVCVAGTHGKTTTSALVASTLLHAGRDPSFVVGGDLRAFGTGARSGRGPHFVAEACEYDRSFLRYRPQLAVVTNVDEDHLDYYRDLADIEEAFGAFAALVPQGGLVLAHEACAGMLRGDPRVVAPVMSYGFSAEAHWRIEALDASRFRLWEGEAAVGTFGTPMVGDHNLLNAAAAAVASLGAGLSAEEAAAGLAAFGGVGRRMEVVAECRGILVLDDYGHHPAEVEATLAALREAHPGRRILVVFQPHQASRTRHLLDAFARALSVADEAWIPPIYFARDSAEARRAVCSQDLARRIGELGGCAVALPGLDEAIRHAVTHARAGDVVVTMGAGDVDGVAHGLADRLS
jgi:UDP-N-acetylmuramate--alanine ligase